MLGVVQARELSAQGFAQKHAELRDFICKKIESAAAEGHYCCKINDTVYFDESLQCELRVLGYQVKYHHSCDWGGVYEISWEAK